MPYVIIAGNPGDGFELCGPFSDGNVANEYAGRHCTKDWHVMTMDEPIDKSPYIALCQRIVGERWGGVEEFCWAHDYTPPDDRGPGWDAKAIHHIIDIRYNADVSAFVECFK